MTKKLVFVSHDSADADRFATRFVRTFLLEGCGLRDEVYYSSIPGMGPDAGTALVSHVEQAVTTCPILITLVTPNAMRKGWVMAELGAAWIGSRRDVQPDDKRQQVRFFPLLVPPMTHRDTNGVLDGLVTRSVDDPEALDEIKDALAYAGHLVDGQKYEASKQEWLEFIIAYGSTGSAGADPQIIEELSKAADQSQFSPETLSAFAARASNDLTFGGGVVADSIKTVLKVRRASDDYWLYDITTTTTYDSLPTVREKQTFQLEPYILKSTNERSEEPDLTGNDDPYSKPWDITLSPVITSRADWDRFAEDAQIWVRAWKQSDKNRPEPRSLDLTEVEVDDGKPAPEDDGSTVPVVQYDSIDLPEDWDVIEVSFRNIPHTTALPAMYFFASDTCVGGWEFTALAGDKGLETRATSVASWRDVASDQTILDAGQGTTTTLRGRQEKLLLRSDVVLVTVRDNVSEPDDTL